MFSGFQGGIGVLLGATGGYIAGFILSGIVWWGITSLFGRSKAVEIIAMLIGLFACYAAGTIWFIVVYTKSLSFADALKWCVVPFIIPDLFKLLLAFTVSERVNRILK